MSEDWKGLDKISAKPKSRKDRVSITRSAVSGISSRRRQAMGCNQSRMGGPWAQAITRFHTTHRPKIGDLE